MDGSFASSWEPLEPPVTQGSTRATERMDPSRVAACTAMSMCSIYLYFTSLPFLSGSFDHGGSTQQSKHDDHPFGSTQCLKEFDLQTCGLLKHLKGLLILSSNCDLRMRPGVSNSCVIFKTGSSSQVSCLPIFFTGKLKVHPWILLVVGTSPYGYTVIIPTPTLDINLKLESLFKTFLSQENVVLCLFVWWFYFYIFPASLNSAGFRD